MTTISTELKNALAEAFNLGLLTGSLQASDWVGITDRRDIYKFTTHQVGDLDFSLTGLRNNANIQLLDSEGTLISGSFNRGIQNEFNTYDNLAPGDYYFKIYGPDTNYNLNFELRLDDAGDSLPEAQSLGLIASDRQIFGELDSIDRRDIYKFTTHQVGDLDFSLTGLSRNANIQLLNNKGNLIGGSYNTGTQDEFNTYNNLVPGDYYFKIYGGTTNYDFDFELRLDDAGNSLSKAQNLGMAIGEKHILGEVDSADTRDIYKFSTQQLGSLEFSLTGLSRNANIQLLNSAGNLIGGSYNTGTQDEFNTYDNLAPGDYYFKVYSSQNTKYNLDFELIPNKTTINGTDGSDTIFGENRNELILGKAGKDLIRGYGGNDTIYGGSGSDQINGGDGQDIIHGNNGNDYFLGGNGEDTLYGGSGNDTIQGQADNDTVYGGIGDDSLYGVGGDDLLLGEDGNDTLYGGIGNDTLNGGDGNNLLFGDNGNDLLIGGKVKDSLRPGAGDDTVYAYGGDDFVSGGDGNDTMYGGDDRDQMYGGDGSDFIAGENHTDFIYGNEGRDKLYGGDDNDYLYGEEGNDLLSGDRGNDKLRGGDNNDVLIGGIGNDTLMGGSGNDIFLYNTKAAFNINAIGIDTIEDFGVDRDRIYLDKTTFTTISSQAGYGFSKTSEFAVVNNDSQVATSTARIVFSKRTGNLFYNQNGAAFGFGSGGHFAILADVDVLKESDFVISD